MEDAATDVACGASAVFCILLAGQCQQTVVLRTGRLWEPL
jgi:hypothetical protein